MGWARPDFLEKRGGPKENFMMVGGGSLCALQRITLTTSETLLLMALLSIGNIDKRFQDMSEDSIANLSSFPSIALRIPTTHYFTRDQRARIRKWRLFLYGWTSPKR